MNDQDDSSSEPIYFSVSGYSPLARSPSKIKAKTSIASDNANKPSRESNTSAYPIHHKRSAMQAVSAVASIEPDLKLVNLIQMQLAKGDNDLVMSCMSYNCSRAELFYSDIFNRVVRVTNLRDVSGNRRDVYRVFQPAHGNVFSVCYMSDSDTLLVCSDECNKGEKHVNWILALCRDGNEWGEGHRLQTERIGYMCSALSDSRVLIGDINSTYLELFRLETGPRIVSIHRILVPQVYSRFAAATCGAESLVAMTYEKDQCVRVHRLRGTLLEELGRIQINEPHRILWFADRLLCSEKNANTTHSNAIIEIEVSGTRVQQRRQLVARATDRIIVDNWCAVNDGIAIFSWKEHFVGHYKL